MDIKVSGSNMSVGSALTEYVEEHLNKNVRKYFDNAVNANVHFSKEKNSFHVSITVNEGVKGGGIDIKSDATGLDVYGVFNEAAEKAAKQLRRYKRKIKNHHREQGGLKSVNIKDGIFEQYQTSITTDFANINSKDVEDELLSEGFDSLDTVLKKTAIIGEAATEQAKPEIAEE